MRSKLRRALLTLWIVFAAAGCSLPAAVAVDSEAVPEIRLETTPAPPQISDEPSLESGTTSEPEDMAAGKKGSYPKDALTCEGNYCIHPGTFFLNPPVSEQLDTSYRYGSTRNGKLDPHFGVEFLAPSGRAVLAAANGEVVVAGDDSTTPYCAWKRYYGNLVVIKHSVPWQDEPLFTLYAHLSEVSIRVGQQVKAGEEIGKAGMSGSAWGPHLHFEVREGDNRVEDIRNPELYLQNAETGTLAITVILEKGKAFPLGITLKELNANGVPTGRTYFIDRYDPSIPSDPRWEESFVISLLSPGKYAVSYIANNHFPTEEVTIEAGRLTHLSIQP